MRARDAAATARKRLAAAGIAEAGFEAEYLVRTAAGVTRPAYFTDPELTDVSLARIEAAVARREGREPATYITGSREFWGLEFAVGPGVLVPRPETELLVELALAESKRLPAPLVVDVGTGSGCIAVSIAVELGGSARVVATDVSASALGYARANARRHRAAVRFLRTDLAGPLARADIVLANLPYIATDEIDALEPEVSRWEPRVALDGGGDGFDLIRRLVVDCAARLRPSLLALEVGFGMAERAAAIAASAGAATSLARDLSGIDRVVCCRWA